MRQYGLPRQRRIRKRADFQACYEDGIRFHSGHFLVFVAPRAQFCGTRSGAAVTRKVGSAVTRNRIKRLLREFCRLHREALPVDADIVAVAKKHAGESALGLTNVTSELLPLMRRAARVCAERRERDGQA